MWGQILILKYGFHNIWQKLILVQILDAILYFERALFLLGQKSKKKNFFFLDTIFTNNKN